MTKKTILIVDDDPNALGLLKETLASEAFAVLTAPDGPTALEMSSSHELDLILLDLLRPGIDGYDVCQTLRENPRTRSVPIIMISGKDSSITRTRGFLAGIDEFLAKPFDQRTLLKIIHHHLDDSRAENIIADPTDSQEVLSRVEETLELSERLRFISPLINAMGEEFTERGLEHLGHELLHAQAIQKALLKPAEFLLAGWKGAAFLSPSEIMCGDFYDYGLLPDGSAWLTVADVAGKGVSAALSMTMNRSILRTLVELDPRPEILLKNLNRRLHEDRPKDSFATLVYLQLDLRTGSVRFSAGGFPPVLVWKSKTKEVIAYEPSGILLGVEPNQDYPATEVVLEAGDLLLLYTDGIVDLLTIKESRDGFRSMEDHFARLAPGGIKSVLDGFKDLSKEKEAVPHHHQDDTTVVVLTIE